jgi:hypothetical protein
LSQLGHKIANDRAKTGAVTPKTMETRSSWI